MIKYLKELVIPSGQKITVDAYHSWTVRWDKIDSYKFSSGGYNLHGGGIGGWSVSTELWNNIMFKYTSETSISGSAKGMLCMGCFENRLGRRLNKNDFSSSIDNQTNKHVKRIIMGNE